MAARKAAPASRTAAPDTADGAARLDVRSAVQRQGLVLGKLAALAATPPQSLVLEGGDDAERRGVARWWAALLNCERKPAPGQGPCLDCAACRLIAENSFADLLLMDEAYYEDGKTRLSVDAVRAIRPVWGQPPKGDGHRVTIFPDIRDLSQDVSNALLKSLEEPRPGNVFVLLTPQRERLLPTLVSRSWVFTLAWPGEGPPPEGAQDMARHLVEYWRTGRGWFDQTQAKIAAPFALDFVNYLMARQRDAMTGRHAGQGGDPVAAELARLFDAAGLRRLDLALARAQEALSLSPSAVNPALVLDWVAASVKD